MLTEEEQATLVEAILSKVTPVLQQVADPLRAELRELYLEVQRLKNPPPPEWSKPREGEMTILNDSVPWTVECEADVGLKAVMFFPERGEFFVEGVRSFNALDEVIVERVSSSGTDLSRLASPIDSAAYSLGPVRESDPSPSLYYDAPWGLVTRDMPLVVCLRKPENREGHPTKLRWVLYGKRVDRFMNAPIPFKLPEDNFEGTPLERAEHMLSQLEHRGGADDWQRRLTLGHAVSYGHDFGIGQAIWMNKVVAWNETNMKHPFSEVEVADLVKEAYRRAEGSGLPIGWRLEEIPPLPQH